MTSVASARMVGGTVRLRQHLRDLQQRLILEPALFADRRAIDEVLTESPAGDLRVEQSKALETIVRRTTTGFPAAQNFGARKSD
jgi:hypothetical protein